MSIKPSVVAKHISIATTVLAKNGYTGTHGDIVRVTTASGDTTFVCAKAKLILLHGVDFAGMAVDILPDTATVSLNGLVLTVAQKRKQRRVPIIQCGRPLVV